MTLVCFHLSILITFRCDTKEGKIHEEVSLLLGGNGGGCYVKFDIHVLKDNS